MVYRRIFKVRFFCVPEFLDITGVGDPFSYRFIFLVLPETPVRLRVETVEGHYIEICSLNCKESESKEYTFHPYYWG